MAEHGKAKRVKKEQGDDRQRTRRRDSERAAGPAHARDEGNFTIGETPFRPPVAQHRALLSMARSAEGKAGIVLQLQRTYGNTYVARLLKTMRAQAKLTVSPPDDVYEREADRVAHAVTRSANSLSQRLPLPEEEELLQGKHAESLQRQTEEEEELLQGKLLVQRQLPGEEEELQMEATGSQPTTVSEDLETRINAARGSGQPLSEGVREPMEQVFGTDFGGVRMHAGSEADMMNRQLGARAFTTGQDIFLRDGEYSPASDSGRKLLAHELTHVVQQTGNGQSQRRIDERKHPATATPSVSLGDRVSTTGIQHKVVQRKPGGILADITEDQLVKGLQSRGCKVKYSDRKGIFAELQKAPEDVDSYAEAVIFLFSEKPEYAEAVAKAEQEISEKKEAERLAAEKKRKQESMESRYPPGVLGTYYRGDDRPPGEITKGFAAFNILGIEEARQQVQTWFGEGAGPVTYHQDWISNKSGGNKIATGNDIGCMGYGVTGPEGANRNVYKIAVPGLREVEATEEVLGVTPHAKQGPKLILNAAKLDDATVIAVGGARAEETTFFTSLKPAWIGLVYEHKADGDTPARGWVTPL